jgi:hypothetical protein
MFPGAFDKPPSEDQAGSWIAEINKKYQGWDVKLNRIFFANGRRELQFLASRWKTPDTCNYSNQAILGKMQRFPLVIIQSKVLLSSQSL